MKNWKRYLPSFQNLSRGIFLFTAALCCNLVLGISWANIFSFLIFIAPVIALVYCIEEALVWVADRYENWRKS